VCEWVPNAERVSVVGEFNNWNEDSNVCEVNEFSKFRLTIPAGPDGTPAIPHGSEVKLCIKTKDGQTLWRMSPWTKYATQNMEESMAYKPKHWYPGQNSFKWQNTHPEKPKSLRVYEAHIGISSPEQKVASYRYFADEMLPRIKKLGYNTVELMAVMEHAYYGSFGYHVTNFYAVSSRYGTPEDFKYLIDTAHGLGLYVILDVVHSHAARNVEDGINQFDGTDSCFFYGGSKVG